MQITPPSFARSIAREIFSGSSPMAWGTGFVESPEYRRVADAMRASGPDSRIGRNRAIEVQLPRDRALLSTGLTSIQKLGEVVDVPTQQPTIFDLLAVGTTDATTIRYIREVARPNTTGMVPEGGLKPEVTFAFEEEDTQVKKVAGYTKVSDELFADYSAVASLINARMPLMVRQTAESQVLGGDGTGANLLGILETPGIQTRAVGADTGVDAIHKALTDIHQIALVQPDGIILHPNDWQRLRLSKDASGQYFDGGPFNLWAGRIPTPPATALWGMKPILTTAIAEGTALVGAFKIGAQVFTRSISVSATDSDQDDFIHNLIAIRAEWRLALAVYRPQAFCLVTGLDEATT